MKRILLWLITLMFLGSGVCYAGAYLDSAHGSSTDTGNYGALRTSTNQYTKGHCAHCHEQHASIGGDEPDPDNNQASAYLLFRTHYTSQTDTICYDCHGTGETYTTAITNYSYSKNFGGNSDALTYDSNIEAAFGHTVTGSSHYLPDIVTQILDVTTLTTANSTAWQLKSSADPSLNPRNPCDACHNPHLAKRSCNLPGSYDPSKSAISRPSDHNNLWGDDTGERMNSFTYQAPYWSGSTNYEPANDATANGSNMPDYVTFCTDCHNTNNSITSSNPRIDSSPRSLRQIDWWNVTDTQDDKHGALNADVGVNLDSPYSINKVLSCTDCHEPHGSTKNVFLIRTEVNDTNLGGDITAFATTNWQYLCARCHDCDSGPALCDIHHANADRPYLWQSCGDGGCHTSFDKNSGTACDGTADQINCTNCHYHGSSAASRRTF